MSALRDLLLRMLDRRIQEELDAMEAQKHSEGHVCWKDCPCPEASIRRSAGEA